MKAEQVVRACWRKLKARMFQSRRACIIHSEVIHTSAIVFPLIHHVIIKYPEIIHAIRYPIIYVYISSVCGAFLAARFFWCLGSEYRD